VPQPTPHVGGVFHAGVTVGDMERSLGFYRDVLGLEVESDVLIDHPYVFELTAVPATEVRVVFLCVPGSESATRIELLEYRGLERHPASARPCDPGHGHLCLSVADVAEMHARLLAAGYRARSEAPVTYAAGPRKGAKAVYATDPDGYHVELFERPAGEA
jgi:lactoylglutathione lyase